MSEKVSPHHPCGVEGCWHERMVHMTGAPDDLTGTPPAFALGCWMVNCKCPGYIPQETRKTRTLKRKTLDNDDPQLFDVEVA